MKDFYSLYVTPKINDRNRLCYGKRVFKSSGIRYDMKKFIKTVGINGDFC